MLIKVCGLTDPANIGDIVALPVNLLGFIFYPPSPRAVERVPSFAVQSQSRVGVFVDEKPGRMIEIAHLYGLDFLQLHGRETPEECAALRPAFSVIKAFPVAEKSDLERTHAYEGACDYFLFDTKGPRHGGNGVAFDWEILEAYQGNTPFFLSGGIGPDDALRVKTIRHPRLAGLDLNSRFETAPGLKDAQKLKSFLELLSE